MATITGGHWAWFQILLTHFTLTIFANSCYRIPLTEILEDCEGVRNRAFQILTPSPQLNYIGIFGNSNPLNLSEWVQLINDTSPPSSDQVMPQNEV